MTLSAVPRALLERLHESTHVVAMTGAGISAESGIPTFREAQTGLWSRYHPEELASPQAYHRNPKLVWEWYAWRRERVTNSQPNQGHLALSALEEYYLSRTKTFTLITQNIDGLHIRAGSQNIIELHGNIQRVKCLETGHSFSTWKSEGSIPPLCPHCGSLLRPDVVWFGEPLPAQAFDQARHAVLESQVLFSIGTSALVEPAASLAHVAWQAGAQIVEINPNPTPLTPFAEFSFRDKAGEILPNLIQALQTFNSDQLI